MFNLPCSARLNIGQIASAAASEMEKCGNGRTDCLTGVMALDGCPLAFARKALEHIGVPVTLNAAVTDPGIDKSRTFYWTDDHIARTINAVHLL